MKKPWRWQRELVLVYANASGLAPGDFYLIHARDWLIGHVRT
jgi:hypothetical protein